MMDYDKMYFTKTEMSQTVPASGNNNNILQYSTDAYADSFDLSLLPSDSEVPLSPQSELNAQSPQISLDYIPATIYHDVPMKVEKPWNENESIRSVPDVSNDHQQQQTSVLLQQLQKHYQLYPSPLPSPPQENCFNTTVYPPSPCPSIDHNLTSFTIKQEYHNLPPSPPDSNGAPSPYCEIKSEPDTDSETTLIDINSLLEKTLSDCEQDQKCTQQQGPQDHQLLREYLQDTSFQKKHNLKPLALESLIGGFGERGDIEPFISLALEDAKRDAQAICASLQISPDPKQWTTAQVHAWIRSTIEQFKLPPIEELEMKFPEDGAALSCLTQDEFHRRASEAGTTIHAQLEIWKLACSDNFSSLSGPSTSQGTSGWTAELGHSADISDDEDEDMEPPQLPSPGASSLPSTLNTKPSGRTGGSHIHLWQFLKELLASPQHHGTAIRWLDRSKGVFKIEDSVRVAKLWGRRKNRPAMNYDKLSRSIRQYYKKGIMKKTERSQRLVYQFCHPYNL